MSRPESESRKRIQDAARELFAERGMQSTSLQDIAARLGITKPALYYHFASREELVRSIVQPLIDDVEQFVVDCENRPDISARELFEDYFDFHHRHRADLIVMLRELTTLADLGLLETVLAWRDRLAKLVVGAEPTLENAARAVIALGGLQDCCLQFPEAAPEQLRAASVDGALAALGPLVTH